MFCSYDIQYTKKLPSWVVLSTIKLDFEDCPVYINQGEFVQIVKKKIGTAPSAGVIGHIVTFIYSWI